MKIKNSARNLLMFTLITGALFSLGGISVYADDDGGHIGSGVGRGGYFGSGHRDGDDGGGGTIGSGTRSDDDGTLGSGGGENLADGGYLGSGNRTSGFSLTSIWEFFF